MWYLVCITVYWTLFGCVKRGLALTNPPAFRHSFLFEILMYFYRSGIRSLPFKLKNPLNSQNILSYIRKRFKYFLTVLRIRGPVPFWPLDLGFGMGKKSRSVFMMQDPDPGWTSRIIFTRAWKQFFELKILKFFAADPESFRSGIENSDPGSGLNFPDPQNCFLVN